MAHQTGFFVVPRTPYLHVRQEGWQLNPKKARVEEGDYRGLHIVLVLLYTLKQSLVALTF